MQTRNYLLGLGLTTAVFISSCGSKSPEKSIPAADDAIPVKIISLNKSNVNGVIHASGQFTTDDETILSFKTGGIINKVYVKEGDPIRKGQLLATLDLTEINALVNQAQIAQDKATRDFKRIENLLKDSVATLEQYQNVKTALDIAQQQLATARFNLSYSSIRAVSDGVILRKIASEGQMIGPGVPVLQTNSQGHSDWILRIAVSDKEWAATSLQDKVKIHIDALELNDLDGFVYSKSQKTDPMTGSFSLDLKLNNAKKLNIASGMFGKAEIGIAGKTSVWQIPYEALLDGNNNEGFVFVTDDNKIALKVPVKVGSIEKNMVEISQGLEGHNALIVSGSAYLTDKSTIVISK